MQAGRRRLGLDESGVLGLSVKTPFDKFFLLMPRHILRHGLLETFGSRFLHADQGIVSCGLAAQTLLSRYLAAFEALAAARARPNCRRGAGRRSGLRRGNRAARRRLRLTGSNHRSARQEHGRKQQRDFGHTHSRRQIDICGIVAPLQLLSE